MFVSLADLLDRREVCRFFGGSRPLNPATLYRGIRQGHFPKPVKIEELSLAQQAELKIAPKGAGRPPRWFRLTQ
jgi:predicted DNA-binding transcriptional regulator AlpA